MISLKHARWLARKNGLPLDLADDLVQESALAELRGRSPKSVAAKRARRLARREHPAIPDDTIDERKPAIDVMAELSAVLDSADLEFGLAITSGLLSRDDGNLSRRFSKIVENARSISAAQGLSLV